MDIIGNLSVSIPKPKKLRLRVLNGKSFWLTVLDLPDVGGVIVAQMANNGGTVDNSQYEGEYRVVGLHTDETLWPEWEAQVVKL